MFPLARSAICEIARVGVTTRGLTLEIFHMRTQSLKMEIREAHIQARNHKNVRRAVRQESQTRRFARWTRRATALGSGVFARRAPPREARSPGAAHGRRTSRPRTEAGFRSRRAGGAGGHRARVDSGGSAVEPGERTRAGEFRRRARECRERPDEKDGVGRDAPLGGGVEGGQVPGAFFWPAIATGPRGARRGARGLGPSGRRR